MTYALGDIVELPSGQQIVITNVHKPNRPFEAVQVGLFWQVGRTGPLATPIDFQWYTGGTGRPLQFSCDDAVALAEVLCKVKA